MLAALTFMPVNTFIIPYAKSINMSMDDYGKCMSLSFLISLGWHFFSAGCATFSIPCA